MAPTPAEDRILSPYTGWTRAHWVAAADATLAATRRYASPRHALIELPGPTSVAGRRSDGLEGFARTFLAAGFRLARTDRADGAGAESGDGGLAQWYAEGLAAGVDPDSPERWPGLDEVHQARVEAASIVLALHESRHLIWDALTDPVRQRLVEWLAEAIGKPYPACNWLWFQNLVHAFLRSVGGPWSAEEVERNIDLMETWYLGDGWYTDGREGRDTGRNFDWYAGWAMNFYPLWYCRISGDQADPVLLPRYSDRLGRYLATAQHLFAPDGPPLHQGRSLTYRYAALAPLWAGAVFDTGPLRPGRLRRLASGVLRHFVAAGARSADGLERIGWYGAFDPIRQPYSGAGSPYWSSKAFAGLVLPADHPVWTAVEEPMEVELRDVTVSLPAPGWLLCATRADRIVRVVNHGTDHGTDERPGADDPGYARHAYTTHTGPEYDDEARRSPLDNHVALVRPDGSASHRTPLTPLVVRGRVGVSRHRAHWPVGALPARDRWPPEPVGFSPGPWLTTASVLRGAVEVRLARVDPAGTDGGPWLLRIGGHPLADDAGPPRSVRRGAVARCRRSDGLTSTVVGLRLLPDAGVAVRVGGNAYGRHSVIPFVTSGAPGGARPGEVYAAAVVLVGPGGRPRLPTVTVTVVAAEPDPVSLVVIDWPDGERDEVRLGPPGQLEAAARRLL